MPNNTATSCTVVLNGHGRYDKNCIIDLTNLNYDITFLSAMKQSVSNGHHNLFLNCFAKNIPSSWTILESIPTTYKANNIYPQSHTFSMLDHQTRFIFDHGLSNADNVLNLQSLVSIDNQRFHSCTVVHNRYLSLNNNSLEIQLDNNQITADICAAHLVPGYQYNVNLNLSFNNLICIKPFAQQGSAIEFKLSDLLTDIIPRIKIPVVYHHNQTVEILKYIFVDDDQYLNKNVSISDQSCQVGQQCNNNAHSSQNHNTICNSNEEVMRTAFSQLFALQSDQYHELTIAGDANIIWDACRDEIV